MNALIEPRLVDADEQRRVLIERAERAWHSFVAAESELYADEVRGGNLATDLYLMKGIELTTMRQRALREAAVRDAEEEFISR